MLARHPAVIWLHGDALTVEYHELFRFHLSVLLLGFVNNPWRGLV
jgi:hypothetical protein